MLVPISDTMSKQQVSVFIAGHGMVQGVPWKMSIYFGGLNLLNHAFSGEYSFDNFFSSGSVDSKSVQDIEIWWKISEL